MNQNSKNASTAYSGRIARVDPAGRRLAFIHPLRSAFEGGIA